MHDNRNDIR